MAPVDQRAQRPLAWQRRSAAAGQQPEPVVEPGRHLGRPERPDPRRGQLDRQWEAVHPPADFSHRHRVLGGHPERRPHGLRPIGEQLPGLGRKQTTEDGGRRTDDGGRGTGISSVVGPPSSVLRARQRQRWNGPGDLAEQAERLPTGGQHPQARGGCQQRLDQCHAGIEQVLAVVHHEQQLTSSEIRCQRRGERLRPMLADAERPRHRRGHQRRLGQRRQLDQPDPVGEPVPDLGRDTQRQARLAHPRRTGQRHQPVGLEQPGEIRHLPLASDEAG